MATRGAALRTVAEASNSPALVRLTLPVFEDDIGESDATVTDAIEDTVDYGEVCQLVALIAQQRSHKTLERLCSTIANRLLDDYELEGVWVKATKTEPPIPLSVDEVSVEVWREGEG